MLPLLSMGTNQKNVQNFVWFVKLPVRYPTDFDGIGCFDTSCMMCFCLNPVFRYRDDKSFLSGSFAF